MPLNQDKMKEREEKENSKTGMGFDEGDTLVRVMPPSRKWFEEDIDGIDFSQWVHFNAGAMNAPPVLCLRNDDKRARCPLCLLARKLKGNPKIEEVYRSVVAKKQHYLNLFEPNHPEKGIQPRRVGPKIRDPIASVAGNRSYGDILHPVTGRSFTVTMTPKHKHSSGYNHYDVTADGAPSDIKHLLPADWGQQLDKLQDELLKPLPFDEVARLAGEAEDTFVRDALETAGEPIPPRSGERRPATGSTPSNQSQQSTSTYTPANAGPPASSQQSPPASSQQSPPASSQQSPPVTSADGKKPCFGKNFVPGSPDCTACADKPACVKAFCGAA